MYPMARESCNEHPHLTNEGTSLVTRLVLQFYEPIQLQRVSITVAKGDWVMSFPSVLHYHWVAFTELQETSTFLTVEIPSKKACQNNS